MGRAKNTGMDRQIMRGRLGFMIQNVECRMGSMYVHRIYVEPTETEAQTMTIWISEL